MSKNQKIEISSGWDRRVIDPLDYRTFGAMTQ